MLQRDEVDEYLQRLEYEAVPRVTLQSLRRLQTAHMRHVPFENLDIHLSRPIALQRQALFAKIVRHGRGGFCYELNGLFAELLEALGFGVERLSARVFDKDGESGPQYDHLTLLVTVGRQTRLVDVGFGDSFQEPLTLSSAAVQAQASGTYRLDESGGDWTLLEESRAAASPGDGDVCTWRPSYVFTLQPHRLAEFEDMCRHHQTSAASPFTRKRVCTLAALHGRLTLSGMRFVETVDGRRVERELSGEAEFWEVAEQRFGVSVRPDA